MADKKVSPQAAGRAKQARREGSLARAYRNPDGSQGGGRLRETGEGGYLPYGDMRKSGMSDADIMKAARMAGRAQAAQHAHTLDMQAKSSGKITGRRVAKDKNNY